MARILVTGAGRGIGNALITEGVRRGHTMVASVRSPTEMADGVTMLQFDVTDRAAVNAAADQLAGPLDVLINNAGVIGPDRQAPLDMDFEGFADTLAINTIAPLAVTHAFLPNLRMAAAPLVAMISSQMGRLAYQKSDRIAYRASKAALNKVMQGLATDLRGENICVRSLDPGWARTDMGGGEADISPAQSASGLMDIIEASTMDDTGSFVNYAGETIPW
ncbi:MAG: SDR family oxidoreductase [Pseudomonadota bacterium]